MKSKFLQKIILTSLGLFILPLFCFAQEDFSSENHPEAVTPKYFKAKVVEILEEKETSLQNGTTGTQQKVKLVGLEGEYQDQEIVFNGLSDLQVLNGQVYRPGQKVYMLADEFGNFYITDTVRTGQLWWLFLIFAGILFAVAKWRGLRSLLVLIFTFLIILKFIVPQILAGSSPVLMVTLGSFFIILFAIYLTEGFSRKSNLAIISISIILFLVGLFSAWFTDLIQITGLSEEAMFLVNSGFADMNFKGLVLAGIIIGSLGVIDDVVINQVELVSEFYHANPDMSPRENYRKSMKVGTAHIGAMVNTLFLAYAGSSILLLVLFTVDVGPRLSFSQIINQEFLALEIARSLIGSIGIILSVPLATFLSCKFLKK